MNYEKKIREYMVSSKVDQLYKSMLKNLFPELAESEDERIRKALIKLVKKAGEGYENVIDGVSIENAISWLEKQADTPSREEIIEEIKKSYKLGQESVKQKPVEWSEEDELRIENLIAILKGRGYPDYVEYLEKLKERYTWKPSEEQLRELENVFGDRSAGWDDKVVESLYNDLRALLK